MNTATIIFGVLAVVLLVPIYIDTFVDAKDEELSKLGKKARCRAYRERAGGLMFLGLIFAIFAVVSFKIELSFDDHPWLPVAKFGIMLLYFCIEGILVAIATSRAEKKVWRSLNCNEKCVLE